MILSRALARIARRFSSIRLTRHAPVREVTITRIAPITEQLILSFVAEKVLDLPKSY